MLLFCHLVDQGCLRSWEHCCVCKVANKVKKRSLADLEPQVGSKRGDSPSSKKKVPVESPAPTEMGNVGAVEEKEEDEDDEMPGEGEQEAGLDLWHRYKTVVNLTVNVRASDVLGDLLQAMREGPLPNKYWEILQERQIGWHRVAGHASCE